jgi:hypothetical protein
LKYSSARALSPRTRFSTISVRVRPGKISVTRIGVSAKSARRTSENAWTAALLVKTRRTLAVTQC